jgi:hypothetical protein
MAEDEIEWSVVIASLSLLIGIHGVLAYTTRRIIINRHALHIANVSLLVFVSCFKVEEVPLTLIKGAGSNSSVLEDVNISSTFILQFFQCQSLCMA